jgi:hypothetical protein
LLTVSLHGFSRPTLSEFAGFGHVVSKPAGAVDAGDRLALRKIQDEPAAAEPSDARLRTGEAPAEAQVALRSNASAYLSAKPRHAIRLADLVVVNPESTRTRFVVDLRVEADRCAFVAVELSRGHRE